MNIRAPRFSRPHPHAPPGVTKKQKAVRFITTIYCPNQTQMWFICYQMLFIGSNAPLYYKGSGKISSYTTNIAWAVQLNNSLFP